MNDGIKDAEYSAASDAGIEHERSYIPAFMRQR